MKASDGRLILRNARAWLGPSSSRARRYAAAVGIVGDRIVAVGALSRVRAAVGRGAPERDLDGRLVLPGFIDNHVHLLSGGRSLSGLDLRDVAAPEDFVRRVRAAAAALPPGRWLVGGRWNNDRWPGHPLPHRDWIDRFTRDVPVLVHRTDGHMALANTCALERAGVSDRTPAPAGGAIDRDESGRLTGLLRDTAMDLVAAHVPLPDEAEKRAMLQAALRHVAAHGVTTVHDMDSRDAFPILQDVCRPEDFVCRVVHWTGLRNLDALVSLGLRSGFGHDGLRLGGVKGFVDGSLGSRTALMFAPYRDDPTNCGLALPWSESGELEARLRRAARAGIEAAVHAIGDRANALLLDIAEGIHRECGPGAGRLRIEHAQHLRAEDIGRFARLDVTASVQPAHILLDGPLAERALGPERAATTYPLRSLLASGANVIFGSDWPVVPISPFDGLYAAVTRRPAEGGFGPEGWTPSERLTIEQAVACYTGADVRAAGGSARRGAIAPGNPADLVAVSEDLLAVTPEHLPSVRACLTLVGGRIVYDAETPGATA